GIDIQILESSKRAGGDYNVFARDMDRMIADVLVGQHGTAEIGQHVGTGEVHMKVLERLIAADARRCCAALERSLAAWLTAWNFPGAAVPRLQRDTRPPEDLEARARRDAALASASGLRPAKSYIERVYGGEWEEAPAPAPQPERSPEPGPDGPDATMARLAAKESGAASDAVERGRLFTKFGRGWRDRAGRAKGSGLGLAICAQILRAFGGSIALERSGPKGSVFCVTLPLTQAEAPMPAGLAVDRPGGGREYAPPPHEHAGPRS
ncbi:MAG: DUF935 family protein, partial [Rhodospirillales bacterium]|nr:DUF935 family protein [Rhodospirillales bacterium]